MFFTTITQLWPSIFGAMYRHIAASDVAALIKKLNLGQVHLLGHSRGGAVVVNVAKTHPEVIKTLILADSVGLESMLPNTPESQRLAQMSQDRIDTLRKNLASEGSF